MSSAGDVHFTGGTAALLADPATAFGVTAPVLSRADLTMVNLETAIAVGGTPEQKSFTFQAPPAAFTALHDAGIDLATMANNHGADYGAAGLRQTLAAIAASRFPVVGIGANADAAYAPYYRTVNGVRVAVVAASQVSDETLAHFSASDTSPGIADAHSARLIAAVRAARARADVVIAYIHWGTEYQTCRTAISERCGLPRGSWCDRRHRNPRPRPAGRRVAVRWHVRGLRPGQLPVVALVRQRPGR